MKERDIKFVIDPVRQVISANDYSFSRPIGNVWGYYLDNRGYEQSPDFDSPLYKFTSKERDRESGYDYFGARYYDSRLGTWGQVEPLLDKYVSFSPYCYGLNNPIVMNDPNGLGPRIKIEGNSIEIHVKLYYVDNNDDKNYGLNEQQMNEILSWETSVPSDYSKSYSLDEGSYNVKLILDVIHMTGMNFNQMDVSVDKNDGYMFVANADNLLSQDKEKMELGVGVIANTIFMLSGEYLKPYKDTGSHEMAHALGIVGHPSNLKDNPNIPSIAEPPIIINGKMLRDKPGNKFLQEVLRINKINTTENIDKVINH